MRVIAGLIILTAFSQAAYAHVVFKKNQASANSYHYAELMLMHGCAGSATTSVRVEMPKGVTRARPRIMPGWKYKIDMKELDQPVLINGFETSTGIEAITWFGGSIPDDAYQQFDFWLALQDEAGRRLDFPVHQKCEIGSQNWDQIAKGDENPYELQAPAPFIGLTQTKLD